MKTKLNYNKIYCFFIIVITTMNVFAQNTVQPTISGLQSSYFCGDNPVTLTGSPAGGVFIGNGIIDGVFYPQKAGVGEHLIEYLPSNGSAPALQNVTVKNGGMCDVPTISFHRVAYNSSHSNPQRRDHIILAWNRINNISVQNINYIVERATFNNQGVLSSYTKVNTTNNIFYRDYNISLNKKYRYRIRYTGSNAGTVSQPSDYVDLFYDIRWPVEETPNNSMLSSYQCATMSNSWGFHEGIDMLCDGNGGQNVYAARSGIVVDTTEDINGIRVHINVFNSQTGTTSQQSVDRYLHLMDLRVEEGDRVNAGQIIGRIGDNHYRQGQRHLHFYIVDAHTGNMINPFTIFASNQNKFKDPGGTKPRLILPNVNQKRATDGLTGNKNRSILFRFPNDGVVTSNTDFRYKTGAKKILLLER